jgi:hypothetical protein
MPKTLTKLPLGGPAWLRAIAQEKEELVGLCALDAASEREEKREVLGLRDAAERIERLETALKESSKLLGEVITGKHAGSKEGTLCHRQIQLNAAALEF